MPKITVTVTYERGDIFKMDFEQQKFLIRENCTPLEVEIAMRQLFPLSYLLHRADRRLAEEGLVL